MQDIENVDLRRHSLKVSTYDKPSDVAPSSSEEDKKRLEDQPKDLQSQYQDFARKLFDSNKNLHLVRYPVHGIYAKADING